MEFILPYMGAAPFAALGLLLLIISCFSVWGIIKRRKAICKTKNMCESEKIALINGLTRPFGFEYLPEADAFANTFDSWQRKFGYCTLYDECAQYFNMVIEGLPIYFDYGGRTWLIEFWRGQYALNWGAEIGTYYADGIIGEHAYDRTLFMSVDDSELLELSFDLVHRKRVIISRRQKTWWLTGFYVGAWTSPKCLQLISKVKCKDTEMLHAFLDGLHRAGVKDCDIYTDVETLTVEVTFGGYCAHSSIGLYEQIAQLMNRINIGIYQKLTAPFCEMLDKIVFIALWTPGRIKKTFAYRKPKKMAKAYRSLR